MKTTEWDRNFPHFAPEEYFSPGGLHLFHNNNIIPCDTGLLHNLEKLRASLNMGREQGIIDCDKEIYLLINTRGNTLRGFVTPEEWMYCRTKEDGQTYSFHLWCAADISSNVSPALLYMYANIVETISFNGIIQYPGGVHVDLRRGEPYIRRPKGAQICLE